MKSTLYPVLSQLNSHPRDKDLQFEEKTHKYTVLPFPDIKFLSVTTWNHSHFPCFDADDVIDKMMHGKGWKEGHKYWGLTTDEIKTKWSDDGKVASGQGTDLHYEIECFMNNPDLSSNYTHQDLLTNFLEKEKKENDKNPSKEWQYFLEYLKYLPHLKPYRTEWMIYHETYRLAGCVDMVYENIDGTLSIYDWKRCKEISKFNSYNVFALPKCINYMADSKFWHYSLQLNTYKFILEDKYGVKIKELILVQLHPDLETFELHIVPNLQEEIKCLMEEHKEKNINNE